LDEGALDDFLGRDVPLDDSPSRFLKNKALKCTNRGKEQASFLYNLQPQQQVRVLKGESE